MLQKSEQLKKVQILLNLSKLAGLKYDSTKANYPMCWLWKCSRTRCLMSKKAEVTLYIWHTFLIAWSDTMGNVYEKILFSFVWLCIYVFNTGSMYTGVYIECVCPGFIDTHTDR